MHGVRAEGEKFVRLMGKRESFRGGAAKTTHSISGFQFLSRFCHLAAFTLFNRTKLQQTCQDRSLILTRARQSPMPCAQRLRQLVFTLAHWIASVSDLQSASMEIVQWTGPHKCNRTSMPPRYIPAA